jgi:hypothetical protein
MMICKVCGEQKDDKMFPKTNSPKGKEYRLKTCYKCLYKTRKENGQAVSYHKTHPEKWCEYQKEYARVKYYDYYKKRGLENPGKIKEKEDE